MELAVSTIECGTVKQTFRLHHITDTHIDDTDHADRELRARLREIKDDPQALWIGGGDYGSLILPSDKRFATPSEDPVHRLPDKYLEDCVERFKPIADKCVGIGTGNHEDTIAKHYHRGVGAELAMRLDIPEKYLGTRGWAILRFKYGKRIVVVRAYQYHGWSTGRLKGRKALQAERDVGAWRADVFFLGHDHQPYSEVFWSQECYDSKGGYKLRNRPVAIINGGAWTYGQRAVADAATKRNRVASEWPNESWAEGKNFRPQGPVSPILEIEVDFGSPSEENQGGAYKGRQSGFSFETRLKASTVELAA